MAVQAIYGSGVEVAVFERSTDGIAQPGTALFRIVYKMHPHAPVNNLFLRDIGIGPMAPPMAILFTTS